MKRLSLLLAGWALFALNACVIDASESGANATVETQTETFIDPDATKESALGLIFGMPQIDDRLDYPGGDREDWRYIIVAEQCDVGDDKRRPAAEDRWRLEYHRFGGARVASPVV